MTTPAPSGGDQGTMPLLDHLDELRVRLTRSAIAVLVVFAGCWTVSDRILDFLVRPIRRHLFEGGDIVFINIAEPFLIYVKASFVAALFIASPFLLYQLWAFVAPGLYRNERRMVLPFLFFGTLCFVGGGAFGYSVAAPIAARWLIDLGSPFTAQITLRSAFSFLTAILLGMGAVFETPVLIFYLSRLGLVTPRFLMRHFRIAVFVICLAAAVITPTGDMMTMGVFAGPMILLYLIGVGVAWLFGAPRKREREAS